jgi:hypothetical protein
LFWRGREQGKGKRGGEKLARGGERGKGERGNMARQSPRHPREHNLARKKNKWWGKQKKKKKGKKVV